MDWSGVDYCDVFIICLDSHSDGTHSLQMKWWNAELFQIRSHEDIFGLPEGEQISIFGWTIL